MYFSIKFNKLICSLIILPIIFIFIFATTFYAKTEKNPPNAEILAKGKYIEVPIIMYHGILKDQSKIGKFVISPSTFENDLKFLKDNGYTTIVIQDLIDYVYSKKPLPEKPIILTFDDGYYNNYLYAFPLLKKYDSKMVISIIGILTDQYSEENIDSGNYSHVTWTQINEMIASKRVEIQNHSYNLHLTTKKRKGSKKVRSESLLEYKTLLSNDILLLQNKIKKNTGYTPTTFTYPLGGISYASLDIIKELGFKASISCESKTNKITSDPECLYRLCRFLRPSGSTSEVYFKKKLKL